MEKNETLFVFESVEERVSLLVHHFYLFFIWQFYFQIEDLS